MVRATLVRREPFVRTYLALGVSALLSIGIPGSAQAQKVDLPSCQSDTLKGKVTTFQVTMPLPPGRAYGRVVRAFIQVGLAPSNAAAITGQVEWNSGTETNFWGDNHARRITATVVEDDEDESKSLIIISPYEATSDGFTDSHSMRPLSNRNGGYGKKVWCAAWAIGDTLRAAAARLALRSSKSVAADSADSVPDAAVPAGAEKP